MKIVVRTLSGIIFLLVLVSCINEDAPTEPWWYNHQQQIPPEASCPPEIDFVLQFPANWAIERMDCEEVWFTREGKDALVTLNVFQPSGRTPVEQVLRMEEVFTDLDRVAMFAGNVNVRQVKNAYTTNEGDDVQLRVEFTSEVFGVMANCKAESHWRMVPVPSQNDTSRYVMNLVGTVCTGRGEAEVERIRIFDSFRFPLG